MLLPPVSMGISRGVQLFIWLLMIGSVWNRSGRCFRKCRAVLQYCEPLTGRCSACSLRCAMTTPDPMYCLQYCKEYYMLYKATTTPPPTTPPPPTTTTALEMTSASGEESTGSAKTASAKTAVIVVLAILLVLVTPTAVALACNYRQNLYAKLQRVSRKYLRCASLEDGEPEEIELHENLPEGEPEEIELQENLPEGEPEEIELQENLPLALNAHDERMQLKVIPPDSVQCGSLHVHNPDSLSH